MNQSSHDLQNSLRLSKVWIIIPIFNRREITLEGLRNLQRNGVLDWCQIVVCDGGSSDGSVTAIKNEFPSVHILEGEWWWMQGIRAGMEFAKNHNPDIYLWLNDDCHPRKGSVEALVDHALLTRHLSGGVTHTKDGAYCGMKKTSIGLRPILAATELKSGELLEADALVGNFVAIPSECVERIGLPDAELFPHLCGDTYYTMEAVACGFYCDLVGSAQADDSHGGNLMSNLSILRGDLPLSFLIKKHFTINPNSGLFPNLRLSRRFWGIWGWGIALLPWLKDLVAISLRAIIPKPIRSRL